MRPCIQAILQQDQPKVMLKQLWDGEQDDEDNEPGHAGA